MMDRGVRQVEASSTLTPPVPRASEPWRSMRFFIDPDSYQWLSFARELRTSGAFRIRQTPVDNVPYGREVHWAQLPIWMLAGLSWLFERVGGMMAPQALELAGRMLMPLSGFLFFSGVFWILARRGNLIFAFLSAVPMACCTLYAFHPMRPDHHGFQLAFMLAALLGLLRGGVGWRRGDLGSRRFARWNHAAAGVFSGLALWLGATVFEFALLAFSLGLAFSLLCASLQEGEKAGLVLDPSLFRWWGVAGALTSMFFYGVEYAPSHFSMRLEVNHPLYALSLWGTAECLRAMARWKQNRFSFGWKDGVPAAIGLCLAALLPLLVLFGPVEWYEPRSTLMLRLHSKFIMEFRPLWESETWRSLLLETPVLPIGALVGLWSGIGLRRGWIPFPLQAPLRVVMGASLVFFLLSAWQVRWIQFLYPLLILLVALAWRAAHEKASLPSVSRAWRWVCVGLGLLALVPPVRAVAETVVSGVHLARVEKMDNQWFRMMLQRNWLLQLRENLPAGQPLRLMLPQEMAPAAAYFGVGNGVGSLYWENGEGMQALAEFFGDPLPGSRTYAIARERGITHVVVNVEQGEGDAYAYYHLLTGKSDYPGVANTVEYALASDESLESDWLRLDARLTAAAAQPTYLFLPEKGQWIPFRLPLRIYEILP